MFPLSIFSSKQIPGGPDGQMRPSGPSGTTWIKILICNRLCWDVRSPAPSESTSHHVGARIKRTTCPPAEAEDTDSLWTLASGPPIIDARGMCTNARMRTHTRFTAPELKSVQ